MKKSTILLGLIFLTNLAYGAQADQKQPDQQPKPVAAEKKPLVVKKRPKTSLKNNRFKGEWFVQLILPRINQSELDVQR